jgi:ABC-type multidrug transport system ATPase subunit
MIGRLTGLDRRTARRRAAELPELFDLTDAANRTTRNYSGGMRRRLDVAASLVGRPSVLFLDEPTTGLDPRSRLALWRLLSELTANGTSVLLTTQYLDEADRLADQLVVLDRGAVIAMGTSAELKQRVGGDRLELYAAPGTDPNLLASAIADLGAGPSIVDTDSGRVLLPVANGAAALPALASRLADAGLLVSDLALRRPSLDDVFLALTGRAAEEPSATATTEGGRLR